jgi:hypothetical protein
MGDIGLSPHVIACPSCPKCGNVTDPQLPGPVRLRPAHQCPRCEHEVTEIIEFKQAS